MILLCCSGMCNHFSVSAHLLWIRSSLLSTFTSPLLHYLLLWFSFWPQSLGHASWNFGSVGVLVPHLPRLLFLTPLVKFPVLIGLRCMWRTALRSDHSKHYGLAMWSKVHRSGSNSRNSGFFFLLRVPLRCITIAKAQNSFPTRIPWLFALDQNSEGGAVIHSLRSLRSSSYFAVDRSYSVAWP